MSLPAGVRNGKPHAGPWLSVADLTEFSRTVSLKAASPENFVTRKS